MKRINLGSKLRRLRLQLGLSAKAVADRLKVAESTYRDWEYGRAIKGEPYVAISKIFGVSLSELLDEEITEEKVFILSRLKNIEILLKEIRVAL